MVGETSGTEIGGMFVKFSADDKDLTIKLSNVKDKLENMSDKTKSATTDFVRFSKVTSEVGAALAIVGVSTGAILALATQSPALAGAMAAIAVSTFNLGQIIGQEVAPIFEKIGQELIPAIGVAIQNLNPQITWLVDTVSQGITDMSLALSGQFSKIKDAAPKSIMVLAGASAGYSLMGPAGIFVGAALGYGLDSFMNAGQTPAEHFSSAKSNFQDESSWASTNPLVSGLIGIGGTYMGAGVEAAKGIYTALSNLISSILAGLSKNDVQSSLLNGTAKTSGTG
jgi:hypothetical protein